MLEPANHYTKFKDASAIPEWARDHLLEWYFGPSCEGDLTVLHVYHDDFIVIVACLTPTASEDSPARSAPALEFHRLWQMNGRAAHSVDASFHSDDPLVRHKAVS